MIRVYLDESGDLGFDFSKAKTTKHLVLAAMLCHSGGQIRRALRRVKTNNNVPLQTVLDAHKSPKHIRLQILSELAKSRVEPFFGVVKKQTVRARLRRRPNLLYNYIAKRAIAPHLLPYIVCQGRAVELIAHRRTFAVAAPLQFPDYLREEVRLKGGNPALLKVKMESDKDWAGLQIVDFFANALLRSYEIGDHQGLNMVTDKIVGKHVFF